MRVFIAEKPSLAATIAQALGNGHKESGFWDCGQDIVTWCYGHLFEPATPEGYGEQFRQWRRDTLPIVPEQWRLEAKKDEGVAAQIEVIKACLLRADCVVNAGDPDREGQLLVDEVLQECGYTGKTLRIWLTALNDKAVAHALEHLEDNAKYIHLHDSALARQRADWLIGYNATRAMTLKGREAGYVGVLSQGRVQTPTLALVVNRDKARADHKSQVFYVLRGTFVHGNAQFLATFAPDENMSGLDDKGRIADQSVAKGIADSASGKSGVVVACEKELKVKQPPLPHCLSTLQVAANAKYGMSAQDVLDTAQALYEKKLTTYPRTDCQYMASAELADAERIMAMLRHVPGLEDMAGGCDLALKSAAWDDGKLGAHTALAPTGDVPTGLSDKESQIYGLIATAYCLQFYPPYQYNSQKITLDCQGTWVARGLAVIEAGWTARQADDEEKDDDSGQALPELDKDTPVTCTGVEQQVKKTSPPPKYTEGSLIKDMTSIHRFITDPAAKAKLRETEGIGTEATRAQTIETLKQRGFLQVDGKALVSTELGQRLIAMTPPELKDPVTTAQWETRMALIAAGKETLDGFLDAQIAALPGLLAGLLDTSKPFPPAYPCPQCGRPLQRRKKKDSEEYFWGCAGYKEGCKYTAPDDHGKPGKKVPQVVSPHKCPKCGKGMIRRESKRKKGAFFWSCSGYPDCTGLCFDKGGRPDFSTFKTK